VPDTHRRDVALVLSGGGINGILLELGFLRRLSETQLWPRVGWIYGTSAGALAGTMTALGRLDDLEEFLMGLEPQDAFRPRAVWQFPGGLHDYTLPTTVEERLGTPEELGDALAASEIELVVYATDVGEYPEGDEARDFELAYSSRTAEPDVMGRAILASAAISGLVLPIRLDGHVATDGGWVRNFPFEHAYHNPDVAAIAAFRYVASYPPTSGAYLERTRERLERFRAVPPVRALLAEVRLAQERSARGEPAHYGELIVRLMRVAFARNAVVEERIARDRDTSVQELRRLQEDVTRTSLAAALPWRRQRLRAELESRFGAARFPFRHERHVPALVVRATAGPSSLDPTFRGDTPWPVETKRALIERGYTLTDSALAAHAELGEEGRQGSGQAVGPRADEGEQAPELGPAPG
jgi:predicted acylesterase/phospholipase RssA